MSSTVYVTGLGTISAIGKDVEQSYAALCAMQSGVDKIKYLQTLHSEIFLVAEVKYSDEELCAMLGVNTKGGYTRTTLLGMIAAREALKNAGVDDVSDCRTGLISGNSVGGMGKSEIYFHDFMDNEKTGEFLNYLDTHDCADSTEKMADFLHNKDYVTTISTACSSSANAIMLGARMIKAGMLDRVVVGGTDALTKFTLNGFNTLMILDKEPCRPFDETRAGLNLGEGAGYIVLESEEIVKKNNKKVWCSVSGYGNANDAYHQTASSPDGNGAFMAIQKALKTAGISASDIDYINVHGTGTPNNDLSEGTAITRVFGDNLPKFSSTKAYTGHTLGACGGIEAVFSALSIRNETIFPNLNFAVPIATLNCIPVTDLLTKQPIRHILSNSFGFGGNNTALVFSKIED
jgi:3-oxoacyl-(acyl-carrier-protein) synthase